ncbi:MAG: CCA tRNA nucleotidyltransferase [Candidatus Bathyarchaeia archaeon]
MELSALCEEVALNETPSREEENSILEFAEKIKRRVNNALEHEGIEATVSIEGSIAKGTWLRSDPEIDIFIQLPSSYPREEFSKTILRVVKNSTKEFESLERYAEHPYLELFSDRLRVNVVPCYRVEKGRWISATDRTPYHTEYVKEHLNPELRTDVRLLKRFMKGVETYGAEIKVGGFSGYLCELLVIYYGSFINTLSAASNWKAVEFIDLEKHYSNIDDAIKFFGENLIVVDPVDECRNVASSVRVDKKSLFSLASRAFLQNPGKGFFYPEKVEPLSLSSLKQAFLRRESSTIFKEHGVPPDTLWGQLHKSTKVFSSLLNTYGFNVIRSAVWSDETEDHIFIFEVENKTLPSIKKHMGPPVFKTDYSQKFLIKHLKSRSTLCGPEVCGDRLVVYVERKYKDVIDLLRSKLRRGGRNIGLPKNLAEAIIETGEILTNMEISKFYISNPKFAEALTRFLEGRPRWLDPNLQL